MIMQSKYLTMLSLGIKKDSDIVDGNYLRWFFDSVLGFPKYGFQLFRREHMERRKECFPGENETGWAEGAHPSPGN